MSTYYSCLYRHQRYERNEMELFGWIAMVGTLMRVSQRMMRMIWYNENHWMKKEWWDKREARYKNKIRKKKCTSTFTGQSKSFRGMICKAEPFTASSSLEWDIAKAVEMGIWSWRECWRFRSSHKFIIPEESTERKLDKEGSVWRNWMEEVCPE